MSKDIEKIVKGLVKIKLFMLNCYQVIIKKGDFSMSDAKDYTDGSTNEQYRGVSSMYSKMCKKQQDMQPKYCMPGEADGEMKGEHRNTQAGP